MAGRGLEPRTHGFSVLDNSRIPLENEGLSSRAQQIAQQQATAHLGNLPKSELATLVDLFAKADAGTRAKILEAVRNIVGTPHDSPDDSNAKPSDKRSTRNAGKPSTRRSTRKTPPQS